MKKRIPASDRQRKELIQLLGGGVSAEENVLSSVIRKGAEIILQELLEEEVSEYLGRGHYERSEGKEEIKKGYRNGYKPRTIKSGEGKLQVELPQLRDTEEPYSSKLATFFRGNTEVLEGLAAEMYARGLSTRDIEDALIDSTGDQILSRTAVSRVTEILQEDFQAFQDRDLSSYQVEYLFLDAVYESIQERFGVSKAVLCAWAICRDGRKVLLHLEMGNHESFDDWREFLRDMIGRGLQMPTTHTTDGSKGLIKAVKACLPDSLRIRCWRHRMQNFQCKVAKVNWPEIKAELYVIREAADYERGKQLAADFIERYHKDYPSLIKAFKEDLEAFLAILKLPRTHRKNVRTTNLIERSFVEERRRTKIVPVFMTEKSLMKLVFATLIRAARRWQKVRFSDIDKVLLDRLRKELGINQSETGSEEDLERKRIASPPNNEKERRRKITG